MQNKNPLKWSKLNISQSLKMQFEAVFVSYCAVSEKTVYKYLIHWSKFFLHICFIRYSLSFDLDPPKLSIVLESYVTLLQFP